MSLYGGIKFAIGKPDEVQDAETTPDETKASTSTAPESSTKSTPQPALAKPTGKSSAALKFAPRIRQAKPAASGSAPAARPAQAPAPMTTYSAEPVLVDAQVTSAAGPSKATAPGPREDESVTVLGADGKPLARAPAMTLAAAKRAQQQKSGPRDEERKKKKKKKRRRQQVVISDFKPDEQYDPNRPNDLAEYQYYRKKLREEKRARALEDKRRKEENEPGSSGESSYYTDSEEDVPRRDAPKMWAPPKIYDGPVITTANARPPAEARKPDTSGDDAYARRLAMSGQDVSARPQTMPTPVPGPSREGDWTDRGAPRGQPGAVPMPSSHVSSGDDAYARRLAMSRGDHAPPQSTHPISTPPQMPPFPPSAPVSMPPFPPSAPLGAPPPPPPPSSAPVNMPPFPPSAPPGVPPPPPPSSFIAPPPFMPGPSVPSAPTPADGGEPDNDFAKLLEEKRKAAASIAARLQNLGPPAAPPQAAAPEPDTGGGTFAEKMMRKWGHKEGSGLGADGSGIVHALTAEHVAKPVDPKQPLSKRQLAKQKAAAANAKNRKWVQHNTTRGRIVNAADAERRTEEEAKYGEAGRVICLVGLVGNEDEIDEDLSEEIGEECSKYGIVERVVQHLVEPPPPDPAECLRVFIVFSGMAGAWRSIRELDGRFFGGRKIRATYFDEARFDRGERDGNIL